MEDYAHSGDEDSIRNEISPQPTASNRLTHDRSLFDDWLRGQREDANRRARVRDSVRGDQSLLVKPDRSHLEDAPIISSPREYQTELFERAKRKNIIAVLDTG